MGVVVTAESRSALCKSWTWSAMPVAEGSATLFPVHCSPPSLYKGVAND
jgi:hypothetical protein